MLSTPFLIPAHWNIGILLHKQAKWQTIMHMTVSTFLYHYIDQAISYKMLLQKYFDPIVLQGCEAQNRRKRSDGQTSPLFTFKSASLSTDRSIYS